MVSHVTRVSLTERTSHTDAPIVTDTAPCTLLKMEIQVSYEKEAEIDISHLKKKKTLVVDRTVVVKQNSSVQLKYKLWI